MVFWRFIAVILPLESDLTIVDIEQAVVSYRYTLRQLGRVPRGVPVPGGPLHLGFVVLSGTFAPVPAPGYFIDRYEVTNEEFGLEKIVRPEELRRLYAVFANGITDIQAEDAREVLREIANQAK